MYIPLWLGIDKTTAEKIELEQARYRNLPAYLNRLTDPAKIDQRHHRQDAELASQELQSLEQREVPVDDPLVVFQRARLTASLIKLGRLDEALAVAPDGQWRAKVTKYQHAVDRPDTDKCHCHSDTKTTPGAHEDVAFTPRHAKENVYSFKHGKIMPVVHCARCPFINVTEETEEAPKEHLLFKGDDHAKLREKWEKFSRTNANTRASRR